MCCGVLGEALGGVAVGPAARVLERLREVPVIERRHRLDAALEQPLDQAAVEAHARRVERPGAVGLHARPRDREAVGLEAQGRHEVEVLAPAVVVIAGDVAGVAVGDGARHAAEGVPDRLAAAVLVRGALDLVGGGGGAEAESGREAGHEAGNLQATRPPAALDGWERVARSGADGGRGAVRGANPSLLRPATPAAGAQRAGSTRRAPPPLRAAGRTRKPHPRASVVSRSKKCMSRRQLAPAVRTRAMKSRYQSALCFGERRCVR